MTDLIRLTAHNEDEYPDQLVSIAKRHLLTNGKTRPIVVTPEGDNASVVNAGITPPGAAPTVSGFTEGAFQGIFAFFVARYDSERDIYSELSPAISPDQSQFETVFFDPDTGSGAEIIGDDAQYDRLLYNGLTLFGGSGEGFQTTVTYTSVFLSLRKTSAGAIGGSLVLDIAGIRSEPIEAAELTDTFSEYEFVLRSGIRVPSGFELEAICYLIWEREEDYAGNSVEWEAQPTSATSPTVSADLTPTIEAIADVIVPGIGAQPSNGSNRERLELLAGFGVRYEYELVGG